MILGLTGGYCAGKSSAAAALVEAGWTVVDVDALGHEALERSGAAVAAVLGPGCLGPGGRPDRKAIGARVFSDPALLERFEAVVHPVMNELVAEAVRAAGGGSGGSGASGKVCIDAALLYRLPAAALCDAIIEVRAPLVLRLLRARRRDGLGFRAVLKRLARQRPLREAGTAYEDRTVVVWNGRGLRAYRKAVLAAAEAAASRV